MHSQTKALKLLTYNVFLRPPPIKTNQDDYKNQRLNDILKTIQNYDIICFQEMFQTATFRKQKVIAKAIEKGFLYWKDCESPSFWSGPPVDSGLLVISKFPILESKFQSYNVGVLSDSASDKGYIYCKIQVKGKILHLFTTHLQASYLSPGMLLQRQLSIKTRVHQFRTLLKKIRDILSVSSKNPKQQLILLMGDLNMNALMTPMTLQGTFLESEKVGKLFVEYDTFLKIFKDEDIKAKNCGFQSLSGHPVTFGNGDTVLTDNLQSLSKQSLDFIFQLYVQTPNSQSTISSDNHKKVGSTQHLNSDTTKTCIQIPNKNCQSLKPIITSTKVQNFNIENRPYTQLSDHYGMSIQIQVE